MEPVTELETTVVISPIEEEIAAISRKSQAVMLGAIAICRLYGPRPNCLCNNDRSRCHARELYLDFALAVVGAVDKAGLLKT